MVGGGKKGKKGGRKVVETDEEDEEEEEEIYVEKKKKQKGKKGKKGPPRESVHDEVMRDDVAIEMDELGSEMAGGGKKEKEERKVVEADKEDEEEEEIYVEKKKKLKGKKGKKGPPRESLHDDILRDDVAIEMDEVGREMIRSKGSKGGKKKGKTKKRMAEHEGGEGDEDIEKFYPKKGKIEIGDPLQDPEMSEDFTIEIDQISPAGEQSEGDLPTEKDVSIEIPDSPRVEVDASPLKTHNAALVLELPEEDKVIPKESDHMDPTPDALQLTNTAAAVAIDIPESPRGEVGEAPLETHGSAIAAGHPKEDVIPQELDFREDSMDIVLDRPGSPEENVAIDIPESPRGEVGEPLLETYDGALLVEHPKEDNLLSQESDFIKDNEDDMLQRPGLPVENVAIDIPESPRGESGEAPFEMHEHLTEDNVLPQEPDFVKDDTDAVLDSPGLAEVVIVGMPNIADTGIEHSQSLEETKVPLDGAMETDVSTENVDQLVGHEADSEHVDANPMLVQEMNTVNDPMIMMKEHEDKRPSSADSIGKQKDIDIKPSDVGNMEDESDIQLGKNVLQTISFPEVNIDSSKTIDQLSEPFVHGDDDIEMDTKTEHSAVEPVPPIEKADDDMPLPQRTYDVGKGKEGKGMDDQDFDLPEEDTKVPETKTVLPLIENDEELPWAIYKKRKEDEDKEKKDDSVLDEIPEDTESDEEAYAPSLNEDLPDPFEAMNALDADDIELNQKTSPHSILQSEQQNVYNKHVEDLKQGIAEEEIKIYLDDFEEQVKQEILMIGNISLGEVQDEERRLREEHVFFQQQQAKVQRTRQQEILQAMERAKKYVMSKHKEKYRELRMREQHLMQKDRSYKDEIHREFRRSESQLRKALKRRKAEVKTMYGDLIFADGQYGGSKGRRWKIDWNRAPQPIQIRLKCLRGVKDKLPESRYVLMVSLYNRLGGNVMKWSSLRGQQWGGATLPMHHNGEFFNIELKIDQSVFTVCPSRPDIRPGMVLVFELFILRGPVTPTDKVVGWGCFPICDAEFKVIEGKYKTPMLRGDMDPGIDKFEIIEKLVANDLENWLCNVYFEIIKLPRYMAGQKEYEVELQFTSGLLGAPNRTKTGDENIDGEKAIFGSRSDVNSSSSQRDKKSIRSASISSSINIDGSSDQSIEKPNLNSLGVDRADSRNSSAHRPKSSLSHTNLQMYRAENLSVDLRRQKEEPTIEEMARPMTSVDASRKLVEEKGLQLSDYGSDESDYNDDDVYALKQDVGFRPVKGEPGMFYKIHYNTPAEVYARKVYTMMPKTPVLSRRKVKKEMTHMEILNTHSYAVKTPWSNKGHIDHKGTKKIQYMGRMLFSELGISQVKSRAFWAMILMIIINFWIRLYLHYIGQWVALYAFLIPINSFNFLPYTVELNYQNTLLRTREEIALIVIGPFTSIILFLLMVLISAFIQVLFERFPNMFSQFIMAFGIHCILDPIWILIVDSALLRFRNRGGDHPIGDAFKLYWHFNKFYRNDNVTLFISIALTTFLYFVTIFCAIAILYMYFLRIHNNGRLMDVYWRLHCKEEQFFIPYDLEISNEEISYICMKAEQWRGEEGERRKTAVYDYLWEEEEMADDNWENPKMPGGKKCGVKETTTHVSIHTLHLDGLRELYRHFLKLPGGAIVEVFGEMNIPGIDEGVKQALIKRTTFQTVDAPEGVRKRSAVSHSSNGSIRKKDNNLKVSIVDNNLGVPVVGESVA